MYIEENGHTSLFVITLIIQLDTNICILNNTFSTGLCIHLVDTCTYCFILYYNTILYTVVYSNCFEK